MSVIKKLVDLQLKEAGYDVDYEYVIRNPQIEDLEWYKYYHWKTEEDYERFKKQAEQIIKKSLANNSVNNVRMNFGWFDMTWGLSAGYLDFVKAQIETDVKKNSSKKKGKHKQN